MLLRLRRYLCRMLQYCHKNRCIYLSNSEFSNLLGAHESSRRLNAYIYVVSNQIKQNENYVYFKVFE